MSECLQHLETSDHSRRPLRHPPRPAPVAVPTIAALAASTSSVQAGGNVSLVAQGVTAGGGTIAGVSFYRDSNGNGQWDAGDALIGTTSSISGGQATISLSTGSLTAGSYRLFARALDTDGQWSSAVSTQLTVTAQATYGTNVTTAVAVAIGSTAQGNVANCQRHELLQGPGRGRTEIHVPDRLGLAL